MVTLRGVRMYEFLDRFVTIALPRVRDFRGISARSFDGRGNYNIGVKEQIIFPEIEYDKIDAIRGLNISITTTCEDRRRVQGAADRLPLPVQELKGRQWPNSPSCNAKHKRDKLVAKYAKKHAELKAIANDAKRVRRRALRGAPASCRQLPRNAYPTRLRNRCALTGRPRGTFRKFGLGRNKIRELAFKGDIPGVVKASW